MGKVQTIESGSDVTITVNADKAAIIVGGKGQTGSFTAAAKDGVVMAYLSAVGATSAVWLGNPNGKAHFSVSSANLHLGGNGNDGDLSIHPASSAVGVLGQLPKPAIKMSGDESLIALRSGDQDRLRIDGVNADAWMGGNGANGDVMLFAAAGDNKTPAKATVRLDGANGNIRAGGPGVHGNIAVFRSDVAEADSGNFDKATIHLNGGTGDIILANADCAEEFEIAAAEELDPGTVVVIDAEGKLRQSGEAYDKHVAGVLSGAGDLRPGIVLDKQSHSVTCRMPVALLGKVYCKVDAQFAPIEVGDLLTTSATPGHAMKATDPARAFGAVIGKALRPLAGGQGLIPILIALQ